MVDLHSHILPYIDDGASSFEEAIEMLRIMIENGVNTVVATPHFNFEKNEIEDFAEMRNDSLIKLKSLTSQLKMPINILSGAELMFTPNLDNYNLNDFVIEGTDYLLVELSTRRNEPDLEYTLSAIIANGYIPILAHIERYSYLIENSQRLVGLIEMGVLMQVNAKTLYSKKKYPFISKLIKNNIVHIISSDAHDTTSRRPNLRYNQDLDYIYQNHLNIINNVTINVKKPRKMRRFLGKYI